MARKLLAEKIKEISKDLIKIQEPTRILDAIKWPTSLVQQVSKYKKGDKIPFVNSETYKKSPLNFDCKTKIDELNFLLKKLYKVLGHQHPLTPLLLNTINEYKIVISMLQARGTPDFYKYSVQLYGSSHDKFYDGKSSISSLGRTLYKVFSNIDHLKISKDQAEVCSAKVVVRELNSRFKKYFRDSLIHARSDDGIIADAAAGSNVVKVKKGNLFSRRFIDILEVHEGWVHIGTTQNGLKQKYAQWLSKGPPRCTATQEGLALLMEIFTFRAEVSRARKINDRLLGIEMAEVGADLADVMRFLANEGYDRKDQLVLAQRIFRGSALKGDPFTKDISYCKGFVQNYNFLRAAIGNGYPELIPFLFVGKINLDDVPLLYRLYKEGLVQYPHYLPPQFRDMQGIAVWMSFSSFFNVIDLQKVREHYLNLFEKYL